MTLCVIDGKQCVCQPDEGMPCPNGTPAQVQAALNAALMARAVGAGSREPLTELHEQLEAATEALVNRCNSEFVLASDPAVIAAEAALERLHKVRAARGKA